MDPNTLKRVGGLPLWGVAFFAMLRYSCGAHVTGGHGRHGRHGGYDQGGTTAGGKVRDPVYGMEVE